MKKLLDTPKFLAKLVILSLIFGAGPVPFAFAQDMPGDFVVPAAMPEISAAETPSGGDAASLPTPVGIPSEFDPAVPDNPLSAAESVVEAPAAAATAGDSGGVFGEPSPVETTYFDKDGNPIPPFTDTIDIPTQADPNPLEGVDTTVIEPDIDIAETDMALPDPFLEIENEIMEKKSEISMVQSQMDMLAEEKKTIITGIDERDAMIKDLDKLIADLQKEIAIVSTPELKEQNKMLMDQATMLRDQMTSDLVTLKTRLGEISGEEAALQQQLDDLNKDLKVLESLVKVITK